MPDLMVIDPPPRGQHPSTATLVVEVAVTTHRHETRKARRYPGAGVDEYWLVDLPGRRLTAYRAPGRDGYRDIIHYAEGDRVPTAVGAPEFELGALLGPSS
jgi:Uma2 family endonuclease